MAMRERDGITKSIMTTIQLEQLQQTIQQAQEIEAKFQKRLERVLRVSKEMA
jgi:hypothetical protein